MKGWMLVMIFTGIGFSSSDRMEDLPAYAIRRMEKAIKKTWSDKEEVQKEILAISQEMEEDFVSKSPFELYGLNSESEKLGYLCLSYAQSKFDKFDYMVLFDKEMTIILVRVLVYRENYGGEISSKRWLKQFSGKSNGEEMKLREDIQAISGATISVRSMTYSVKNLSKDMVLLKNKGYLDK